MKLNLLYLAVRPFSTRQGIKAGRFVTIKCRERGHEGLPRRSIALRVPRPLQDQRRRRGTEAHGRVR